MIQFHIMSNGVSPCQWKFQPARESFPLETDKKCIKLFIIPERREWVEPLVNGERGEASK